MKDTDQWKDWDQAYKHAISVWGPWLEEAKKDLKFFLGDQWDPKDKKYLAGENRNVLTFNRIRRVVKLIEGFQRKNRLSMKVDPVEGSDEKTASQFSGLVQHIMQTTGGGRFPDAYHTMSRAFSGALKTGINLVNIYMDYRDDVVNGDIRFKRVPFNRFLLDPNFAENLLGDCTYLLRREWLTKGQAKSILPMRAGEIDNLPIQGRDDKFTHTPQPMDLLGKNLLRYDEFYKVITRPATVLIDPNSGAQKKWTGDKERLGLFLKQFPFVYAVDKQEETVELSIFIEDELMFSGPEPTGIDVLPFIAIIAFYDPEYEQMKWKLQGIVRCMRDPQTEGNKRRVKMLDWLDSQLSPYKFFEEDALVDKKQAFQTGQGRPIWFKSEALSKGKVQVHPPPDIPAGLFRLQELMDKDIDEIPGANAELFGTPENPNMQVAGFLSKMRQAAGLTILQDVFDDYRMSKKGLGQKEITMIQRNWTPAKVKRIINEEPTREFYDRSFGAYDAVPQEGILTDTQRHMYFAQLVAMKEMGAPIPWAAIFDAAPLEQKTKLKEMIQQAEQAQAQASQVDVMDRRLTQKMMQSKITSDMAGAQEKRAQAIENMASATLDRIKTIREIGKLDDEHLMGLIDWIRGLEAGEQIAPAAQGGSRKVSYLTRR